MTNKSLVLVVNPGSASRKYSLYNDSEKLASINFEFENEKVISKLEYANNKYSNIYEDSDLTKVSHYILPLLVQYQIIDPNGSITAIGIRIVAPSDRFMKDELVTEDTMAALEAVSQKAPLHVNTVLAEIKQLKEVFVDVPIMIISDSAFHSTKPSHALHYGIDIDLAEKIGLKRFGYHGISASSVVRLLSEKNMLQKKAIICHIGSGSSVIAILDGKSIETTMGYTPLEGLMMATRVGNIDPSAVMAIKHELKLADDEVESYLNKKCGLLGVSGSSGDIRQLLKAQEGGDTRATLALNIFIYRIQMAIGQMAACLNGVDQIVFTATVGERSAPIRHHVLKGIEFLGFEVDDTINETVFEPKEPINIGTSDSKPIIVVSTDESSEIARRATEFKV